VVSRGFNSERGRKASRNALLHSSTQGDALNSVIAFTEISCLSDIEITPAIESLVDRSCAKVLEMFFDGGYQESDAKDFLNLWRGRFSRAAFNRLIKKTKPLAPEMMASFIFAIGNKYAIEGNDQVASFMFDFVQSCETVDPLVETLTKRQYAKLRSWKSQRSID
jgi:hypothetical protein